MTLMTQFWARAYVQVDDSFYDRSRIGKNNFRLRFSGFEIWKYELRNLYLYQVPSTSILSRLFVIRYVFLSYPTSIMDSIIITIWYILLYYFFHFKTIFFSHPKRLWSNLWINNKNTSQPKRVFTNLVNNIKTWF